ncbi:MAG: helix-turn-helix transcriptional regulator [Chloroflexota bacterium]|nr:helix-turn-helix transcriptional regulator [Chloroflexota bacterium]MDQ6905471.1 helix-turn-helix transcriptional regulator [Chloroflexota bacterium]
MPRTFNEIAAEIEANPDRRARVDGYEREMREQVLLLQKLREHRKVTQHELADALGVAQSNISRIEHEDDPQVSTVRKFVEALGGELVLQAKIGDEMIDLLVLATE